MPSEANEGPQYLFISFDIDVIDPAFVPGMDVPAQRVYRRVHTVDIAPTLAAYIGSKPPSGATGKPLTEVVGQH